MENRNFRNYTVQDLMNKMKKLHQKYKQEKEFKQEWNRKRKKWRFFDIMDAAMSDKPQVKPPVIINSSTVLPPSIQHLAWKLHQYNFQIKHIAGTDSCHE